MKIERRSKMEPKNSENPAPTLTYIFASEIIDGNWNINNIPPLLKDDIIALVERLTGKNVDGE